MTRLAEYAEARELTVNLMLRELRGRYKRSALGWTWSLLNPLSTVIVFSIVFAFFLKVKPPVGHPSGLDNFAMFLLCGLLPFNYLSNSMNGSLDALLANSNLIRKVYFPREVLVVSTIGALLHEERDEQRADRGDDEHLAGEVHLADQVAVGEQGVERAVHAVRQVVERQQAAQEEHGEVVEPAGMADRWLHLEEEGEDDREDDDGRQRVQQRPRPAQGRPLVAASQLPEHEIDRELTRFGVLGQSGHRASAPALGGRPGGSGSPRLAGGES